MKNFLVGIAFVSVVALCMYIVFKSKKTDNCQSGTVIVLNGPSASGKSSIQREFQFLMMPNLWIKLGVDILFDKPMPDIVEANMDFWQKPNPIRWVTMGQDAEGNSIVTLFTGDQGDRVAYGMNSAIAAYAANGCNIIVDYIAYKKEWIDDLRLKLKNVKTCMVKVVVPLEVIEQREIARATSPKGHARSHYSNVDWDIVYDLEVDGSKQTAQEIAQSIKEKFLS